MTLVVGVNAGAFALLAADSRITTRWPSRLRTRADCCQKVVRVGEATIAGFCGDLVGIAEVLNTLSLIYQSNPAWLSIEEIESRFGPALAGGSIDFQTRKGRPLDVGVMFAGRTSDGQFRLLQYRPPNFNMERFGPVGFAAMGSGEPVIERVAKDFIRHMPDLISFHAETNTGPDVLAWEIGTFVERHLPATGIESVGRVLHTVCVERHDVTRVPYAIRRLVRLDADSVEHEVIVGTRIGSSGEWVQYSGPGDEIALQNPTELVTDLKALRFDRSMSW